MLSSAAIDCIDKIFEEFHFHLAVTYLQFADTRERKFDIALRRHRSIEDLQHMLDALFDLITRVRRLRLNMEVVQWVNRY